MLGKITFHEKFEAVFITMYYKNNMMFVLEFPTEGEADRYMRKLSPLVAYHTAKPFDLQTWGNQNPGSRRFPHQEKPADFEQV